jgi:glycosyltransferase involved in cell wall biosynthesis
MLVPSVTAKGGISYYFSTLKDNFSLHVDYFIRGARYWPYRSNKIYETVRAVKDLLKYFLLIKKSAYSIVQTNTSLGSLSIIRDGMFILLARLYRLKVIVFFRGWNKKIEEKIEKKYLVFFKWFFFNCDCAIVLSSQFKNKLREWGYKNPIYLETTVVDQNLTRKINEKIIANKYKNVSDKINLLFLARVEIAKGIYETVESYVILKKRHPKLALTIAGDGFELEKVKKIVDKKAIADVQFLGFVTGRNKIEAFENAHIYVFPSYTEGMPNSVLEAMAFGLPVITRSVGGIIDFFTDGKNGFITDSKDPKIFADMIEKLLLDKNLLYGVALENFQQAHRRFLTKSVICRLEKIYYKFA